MATSMQNSDHVGNIWNVMNHDPLVKSRVENLRQEFYKGMNMICIVVVFVWTLKTYLLTLLKLYNFISLQF